MIIKSVTPRRRIVFPVKITMCNHKVNHLHSCLNHHCKMYETSLHTVQSDQGTNQKQHRRSCQQNGIQYPGSVVKRPISCSTWPSMKFIMLTITWIPTIIGILILICLTSTTLKPINKKTLHLLSIIVFMCSIVCRYVGSLVCLFIYCFSIYRNILYFYVYYQDFSYRLHNENLIFLFLN